MDTASTTRNHRGMEYVAEEIAGVFGRAATQYDTVIPFFAPIGGRLVDLADLRPGEAVLDVGSGRGATLIPAAERVGPSARVLGIDLSEEMVAQLNLVREQRGLTNASVRRMDAEAMDVEASSFDVAVSSFVLHVLPHPDVAAAELWRVLRPGGRVAASVPRGTGPGWDFLLRLFGQFAPRATRPIPVPFRPDFDLESVLRSAGFTVVTSVEDQLEFFFADEQEWWDWAWSSGMRGFFEVLRPPDLEELRQEAFTEVGALRTPAGVPLTQAARFVIARKAAE